MQWIYIDLYNSQNICYCSTHQISELPDQPFMFFTNKSKNIYLTYFSHYYFEVFYHSEMKFSNLDQNYFSKLLMSLIAWIAASMCSGEKSNKWCPPSSSLLKARKASLKWISMSISPLFSLITWNLIVWNLISWNPSHVRFPSMDCCHQ